VYTIDDIIDANKFVVEKRGVEFDVDLDILVNIVFKLNNDYNHISNKQERIMKQTAYLMGSITFKQPFFDGNKTTSLLLGINWLRQNGYDLPLESEKQRTEVFEILTDIMYAKKGYSDLEVFIKERVVSLS
jgi:prophage maintenance system killer protein